MPGLSVIAAAAYVLLQRHTQVAGEWVVGGFEAKGLAYALVFFGIERFIAGRWNLALTLLGAATALHVLVGGWSLVALAFAGGLEGTHRFPARKLIPGLAAGAGLALCGLVPALALNWGVPRDVLDQANQIYVYQRLPHHLNPLRFSGAKLAVQLAFACLFVLMSFWRLRAAEVRLTSFVLGTVAIALVGGGLALATQGYPSVYASLMSYFWFRLSDAMLPLGVVLLATATVAGTLRIWLVGAAPGGGPRTRLLPWAVLAGMISAIGLAWPWRMPALTGPARAERGMQGAELAAWRDVCAWIRANTPSHACFLTPLEAETFKWQAQRGQFVNWKDIPQDARGIVEWKRRIDLVVKTRGKPEALRQLAAEHGVAYVLLGRSEALEGMADSPSRISRRAIWLRRKMTPVRSSCVQA